MNRLAVYFAVIIFIALLFFYNSSGKDLFTFEPETVKKEEILNDFKKLADDKQTSTGEVINIKYIFFPLDYTGEAGDLFYVGKETGDNYFTEKYLIKKTDDGRDLIYILKDTWENVRLPEAKFETYIRENNEWVK